MPETYQYIIIGAGVAGANAVDGIREIDRTGPIALFGAEPHLPYDRPPLSKGLWTGKTKEPELLVHDEEYYRSRNVRIFRGARITRIDPKKKEVVDIPGNSYGYSRLLIATGGTPRKFPFGNGLLQYYRTWLDYRKIRGDADRHKEFLIIGGGFIGSELAASLTMAGNKVTVLVPDEYLLARILPASLARSVLEYCRTKGVNVVTGDSAVAAEPSGDRVTIITRDGKRLETDVAIAAIGIQPGVELAKATGLEVGDGINVSPLLSSSDPVIFAAGDVAAFPFPSLDETLRIEHWDNARAMGKQAGRNMAGAGEPYEYLPYFWTDIFDLGCEAIGKLDARLSTFCDWRKENKEGVVYYLEDKKVKGILLWNVWEKVPAARALINEKKKYPDPKKLQGAI